MQFQLVDEPGSAFRAPAVLVAAEQRDLELEPRDHRFRGRDHRTGLCEIGLGGRSAPLGSGERGAQLLEFGGGPRHGRTIPHRQEQAYGKPLRKADLSCLCRSLRPTWVSPVYALEKIGELRR